MTNEEIKKLAQFLNDRLIFQQLSSMSGMACTEAISDSLEEFFSDSLAVTITTEEVEEYARGLGVALSGDVARDLLLSVVSDIRDEGSAIFIVESYVLKHLLQFERNSNKQ